MDGEALPVAVIGVGGFGAHTLAAARQAPSVRLVGLADRDAAVAAKAGRELGVPHFSDNRALLAQTKPAAVFLAVPPAASAEIVMACAERGIHVWKELPLARNLGEGVALVRRMEQAGLKLAIGTQRRFAAGYRRAKELRGRLGHVFLARSHYLFNWGPQLAWRGDKASAGGGALMELGYHPIDLLVWLLGLPDEVYGVSTMAAADAVRQAHARPIYDTDDTAAAILRWANGLTATVATTRCAGPVSEDIWLYGQGGSLMANGESCLLRDPDGNVLDSLSDQPAPLAVFRRQVEAFATAIRSNKPAYECSARENLLNLAVIEAVYLSSRTSQPESPARLLKSAGLNAAECLLTTGNRQ